VQSSAYCLPFTVRVSPDLTDEKLRQRIRERTNGWQAVPGYGNLDRSPGRRTAVQPVRESNHERELEREVSGGRENTYALAHEDCFRIWREESRREQPPPAHD
jgi:hypothetical protein